MRVVVTPEFREVRQALDDPYVKAVVVPGGVGAGKTFVCNTVFFSWMMNRFAGGHFAVATKTASQFRNVVLAEYDNVFLDIDGSLQLKARDQFWEVPSIRGRPNRLIRVLGTHANVIPKIKGLNLHGLFVDEFNELPTVEIMRMLFSRVRRPGSKILMTANPKDMLHWSWLEYLSEQSPVAHMVRRVDMRMMDNPGLDELEKQRLYYSYPPGTPEHDRMVLGKWVPLSGSVFVGVDRSFRDPPAGSYPAWYQVAVDVGSASATHALLIAHYQIGSHVQPFVVDEWRFKPQGGGPGGGMFEAGDRMVESDQIRAIVDRFDRWPLFRERLTCWVVDPAESNFKVELYHLGGFAPIVNVNKKDMSPEERAALIRMLMQNEVVCVADGVGWLKSEMANMTWDPRVAARGEMRLVGSDDHGIDAFGYWCQWWNTARVTGEATRDLGFDWPQHERPDPLAPFTERVKHL